MTRRALIHPAGIPLPAVRWSRTRETVALAWLVAGWVVRMHTDRKRRAA